MEHDGGKCEKKNVYIYMWDWVILLYSRKRTEHCKPAIMEKIKIIIKINKIKQTQVRLLAQLLSSYNIW